MRASEFIIEKINISNEYQQKLTDIVYKWGAWVNSTINEYSEFDKDVILSNDTAFHRTISNQLVKYLTPTMKSIVNKNISPSFTPDENYEGHKLRLELAVERESAIKGGTYDKWSKLYTKKPKYILTNKILLSISPAELKGIIKHDEKPTIDLASSIAHELTHITQSLRSTLQMVHAKPYTTKHSDNDDVNYFIKKFESESFAEGTVLKIINKAKQSSDPKQYIVSSVFQPLKMGISVLFNRELFPNQDFNKIKSILKSKDNSPNVEYAKQQAWKRFNKKIYEKLTAYLNSINS